MATHKIEKELLAITKVARKDDEDEQDYFQRLYSKVYTASEDAQVWEKLSEPAQDWVNAAGVAFDAKEPIPNFDGEVPTADDAAGADAGDGGEADGETGEEAGGEEETVDTETKKAGKKSASKASKKTQVKAEQAAAKEGRIPTKKTTSNSVKKEASAKKAAANGGAKRGRKGEFNEDSKITKVAKENPFREGSKAAKCFAEYKVGRTVKDVLSKGVPRSKLARHAKKGIVSLG